MEDNELISIIVPVYNVEKYIEKCINSLINQTYSNIEIILVDDGSTDSSGKICDTYLNKEKRIKVIHKKNEGLGLTRNVGIDNANGKYLVFVDSDDFVHEELIENLYITLKENNADTCYCGFFEYYSDDKILEKKAFYDNKLFQNKEIIDKIFLEMIATLPNGKIDSRVSMSVWHGMYSKKIISDNKIYFPSEREYISEDIIFHMEYLQKARKVFFISKSLYYYRQNNISSLTHKYNKDEFYKHKKVIDKVYNNLLTFLKKDTFECRCDRYILGRLRACLTKATIYNHEHKEFNLYEHVKVLVNDADVRKIIDRYKYKENPFKQKIFNFFIKYKVYILVILFININYKMKNVKK